MGYHTPMYTKIGSPGALLCIDLQCPLGNSNVKITLILTFRATIGNCIPKSAPPQ